MNDIEIEINGIPLKAAATETIIEVADKAGIYIPRFCYHKNLSIAANCRMCLVEVEKSPKTLPACATPVTAGMKVFTQSPKTLLAQRAVMEFLLINHPLDCPICDQGGECELQDVSMGYGADRSPYEESKRAVGDLDLGPLIATEMTRCIHCTRCVRFGNEVAGFRELGGTYRGETTEIGTFIKHTVQSEISGNIIDLCPVGALTSKPFRFKARAWELEQYPGISPHDCLGTNVNIHTHYGKVKRIVSRENLDINDTWISDRDRFSYLGLYHQDRLSTPMIKIDGQWKDISWSDAFETIASRLADILSINGPESFGALASPSSTLEEFYLLQKITRGLKSNNVDHRLLEQDMRDQNNFDSFPGFTFSLPDLEKMQVIFLIGSYLQKEQPIAAVQLQKAAKKGAIIVALNTVDYDFHVKLDAKQIVAPHLLPQALAAILKMIDPSFSEQASYSNKTTEEIANLLQNKEKIAIILGSTVAHHPNASSLRYLALSLAKALKADYGLLTDGANSAGAWLSGAIPHRGGNEISLLKPGLSAYEMLRTPRSAYLLLNIEPDKDTVNTQMTIDALRQAQFVVALSCFRNSVLSAEADVILPMAAYTESSGTYVNAFGNWQSFKGVAKAYGEARPAWKILRVLGNYLHINGMDYQDSEEVKREVKTHIDSLSKKVTHFEKPSNFSLETRTTLSRIGDIPLYATDNIVRRSDPLQIMQNVIDPYLHTLRIHPITADELKLRDGDMVKVKQKGAVLKLPLQFDERIALSSVFLPGCVHDVELGDLFGEISIEKI